MKGLGSKMVAGLVAGGLMAALATPAMAAGTGFAMQPTLALANWIFVGFDYLVIGMLAMASIAGVALAIDAVIQVRESKICPPETTEHLRTLVSSRQFKELMDFTATDTSFVSKALYAGVRRAHLKYPAMREAMDTEMGDLTANLFRRIEPLNVIGNIGPLLGLLGTVLGMIMAFYKMMETAGTPKPAELAGGIGTALWHTFLGLMVAIPCLVFYGFYRTRVDRITSKAALVSEDLLEMLRPEATAPEETVKLKKRVITAPSPVPQPQSAE